MAKGIVGIENVMAGLNTKLLEYEAKGTSGLRSAAAFIRGDMEKTSPKVPVDTNVLRSSWFTETIEYMKHRKAIIFGFSANYAAYVHENMTAQNWNRPGSGPKFLEAAIKRNTYKILLIIRGKMTSGGTKI